MNKYLHSIILIFILFLICTGCNIKRTAFKEGCIITPDNIKYRGYVKIDTCEGSFVHYKHTQNDTARLFPFAEIKAAATVNDSFIVIEKKGVKSITLRYYNYKNDIIVRVIEDGAVSLFTHCTVEYSSSMFKTDKYILYCYILGKKGEDNFYRVPFEPVKFLQVAEIFLSDNIELMAEINETDYLEEIVHEETGEKFTHESVSSEHIIKFVQKYNQWAENLNKE